MSNQAGSELITEGLQLLVFGMGIVALFLTLLVIATAFMSNLIQKYFPERLIAENASSSPIVENGIPDARTLSIIKEAIQQHRDRS